MNPEIRVEQGRFQLSTVDVLYATKDLLVIEIDCDSKYPGWIGLSTGGDEGPQVSIFEDDERSLKLDKSTDAPSVIVLPKYTDDWTILTEGTRYTVRIVAYNRKHRPRRVWQS